MDIFPDDQDHLDFLYRTLNKACKDNDLDIVSEAINECLNNMDKCLVYRATPLAILVLTHKHPLFSDLECRKRLYLELYEKFKNTFGEERARNLLLGLNK